MNESNNGGQTWTPIVNGLPAAAVFQFAPVFALNQTDANQLILGSGGAGIWELAMQNNGQNGNAIQYTWTNKNGNLPVAAGSNVSAITFGTAVSTSVYVGFTNGQLWRTWDITAAVPEWEDISGQLTGPNGAIGVVPGNQWNAGIGASAITAIVPYSNGELFVSVTGIALSQKVYEVIDQPGFRRTPSVLEGINITGSSGNFLGIPFGLPNGDPVLSLAVNSFEVAPDGDPGLFAGTANGVYYLPPDATVWAYYGVGLPVVRVTGLQIDVAAQTLFAGTYGRGVYSVPLPVSPPVANGLDVNVLENSQDDIVDPCSIDFDPAGNSLFLTAIGNPSHGTATIANNQVVYTPNPAYLGQDTVNYTISDYITGLSATAAIDITVYPPHVSTTGHWANSVIDYSSEYSTTNSSAEQALGVPNTFSYGPPYANEGPNSTAWRLIPTTPTAARPSISRSGIRRPCMPMV